MRKLAALTFITLDGVMQAPKMPEEDFSGGFDQGGWADPYWDEVMAMVSENAMAEPYEALFGRRTFDVFAENATPDHPMHNFKKSVVTSSPETVNWHNTKPLKGDVVREIKRLKAEDGLLLQIHGSWQLIQALLSADIIDELRLWTFPVIVGKGKRLFDNGAISAKFALHKTDSTENGVVMGFYRRDG